MSNLNNFTIPSVDLVTAVSPTVGSLANYHGLSVEKTSGTDLQNIREVRYKASLTASEKVESHKASSKYASLHKELLGQTQVELNNQQSIWNSKEGSTGYAIIFENPPVYSRTVDSNDNVYHEHISSSQDASIPYVFFMLRYIEKGNARLLEPDFNITTKKQSASNYNNLDLYKMFLYYDHGDLKVMTSEGAVNKQVITIFKRNAEEFSNIVKNVYKYNIDECNYLKEVPTMLQVSTCFNAAGKGPEQTLSILTCLEIFQSVKDEELCPELNLDLVNYEDL
ncbi:hypothetical protein [Candidatus Bandiella numerosa]|uniref:hypothetical protein n=1 Tax=Candidatus Bandiella numerosa TaxID=2570586 RepID=UPI001F34DA89|nr:hypothetical protein [Candidatus Bandiella numerosa]